MFSNYLKEIDIIYKQKDTFKSKTEELNLSLKNAEKIKDSNITKINSDASNEKNILYKKQADILDNIKNLYKIIDNYKSPLVQDIINLINEKIDSIDSTVTYKSFDNILNEQKKLLLYDNLLNKYINQNDKIKKYYNELSLDIFFNIKKEALAFSQKKVLASNIEKILTEQVTFIEYIEQINKINENYHTIEDIINKDLKDKNLIKIKKKYILDNNNRVKLIDLKSYLNNQKKLISHKDSFKSYISNKDKYNYFINNSILEKEIDIYNTITETIRLKNKQDLILSDMKTFIIEQEKILDNIRVSINNKIKNISSEKKEIEGQLVKIFDYKWGTD